MTSVSQIFKEYGLAYIASKKLPRQLIKVIWAIINCRTSIMGHAVYRCEECNELHSVYRSCGNRHCPSCQNHKTFEWTERQIVKSLPGHYFMITFTVPEQIRAYFLHSQRKYYSALFKASSQTIKAMIKRRNKDNDAGFWGVLHTWGRQLQYHPHIHYVVPGGVFCPSSQKWKKSDKKFFLPVKAMSKVFRAKFRDLMKNMGEYEQLPPELWEMNWNVDCRPAGNSKNTVKYLARYVFKIAISDSRIIGVSDGKVYFKYRKQRSTQMMTTCLSIEEFIRRYLQHVLPSGFMKIRYFGFMHPSYSVKREQLIKILEKIYGKRLIKLEKPKFKAMVCKNCGKENVQYIYSVLPGYRRIPAKSGVP